MQELMATDRAKHNILPLTKFGLMQITRQRVRPAMEINTSEKCPTCNGTGKLPPVYSLRKISRITGIFCQREKLKAVLLEVHPLLKLIDKRTVFQGKKMVQEIRM
jgi:ribonuclease G